MIPISIYSYFYGYAGYFKMSQAYRLMIDPGFMPHVGGPIIDRRLDFITVNGIPITAASCKATML